MAGQASKETKAGPKSLYISPVVNFSPMSPKLFRTYPHREEDWGIDLAPLFL